MRELNLARMVITLIISNSLANLVKTLIDIFILPLTNIVMLDENKNKSKFSQPTYLGKPVDTIRIINQVLSVVITLIVSFGIYLIFDI